jgi:DNA repair exonuclease SbcCD ATPase subunit
VKITAFKARNVFQHALFEQPINGNLIGIIGPNGSGKSNLLKSIQFALTGEVPDKRKEQLLSWGATDGGEVTVEFVHAGIAGSVTRSVSGGKTGLKYGPGVDMTGITNVNSGVADHLGLDRDIARTVFVPQSELDSILFDQASKRELAFQRMCGIGEAAKIHKQVGQLIMQKFPPLADFDEQIALGRAEMNQMEQRTVALESQLATLTNQLTAVDEEGLRQSRIRYQETNHVTQAALRALQRIEQLASAMASDQDTRKAIQASTNGIDMPAVDAKIAEAQATYIRAKEWQTRLAAWKAQVKALQDLGKPPVADAELEKLSADLVTMRSAVGTIQGNLGLYDDLLKAVGKTSNTQGTACPVCGAAISDFEALKIRLGAKIAKCRADLQQYDLTGANQRYQVLTAQATSWDARHNLLTTQEAQSKQLLDATQHVDADIDALQAEITNMQHVRSELERMFRQQSEVQARLDLHGKQLEQAMLEQRHADTELANLGCQGTDYTQLQQQAVQGMSQLDQTLQSIQQQRQVEAGINGQLSELKARMLTLKASLDTLVHRREQQGLYNQVRTTIEHVKEWLHYANGPHALSVAIMNELTDNVNTFLQKLNAPFAALTDETDLSYRCPFTDGRPMPADGPPEASELSGGQKTLLAISFRLASYCMFANRQGLLALDEPSAWLDDANIDNFCTLLDKVKELAKAMELQIWISTHERRVLPYCDTVLDLYPGGSQCSQ